jgi:hypothetical protein
MSIISKTKKQVKALLIKYKCFYLKYNIEAMIQIHVYYIYIFTFYIPQPACTCAPVVTQCMPRAYSLTTDINESNAQWQPPSSTGSPAEMSTKTRGCVRASLHAKKILVAWPGLWTWRRGRINNIVVNSFTVTLHAQIWPVLRDYIHE